MQCIKEPSELSAFSLSMLFFSDFCAQKFPLIFPYLNTFLISMSLYFALYPVENNINNKYVKFQVDLLNFCDFIQVFVFTTNHHLNGPLRVYRPVQTTNCDQED